ncbi:hypothetical protein LPB72_11745 [Hydrogenophaga crassostreae]|uniref:Uncharacterized protein n=1 Tax=Hydrogenophaga crassostreae TaxID=1763535 RepID=A0A163CG04_9BURK|nr:hypothetical protein LPB072_13125 [Hydrogenophaga crassostreae]OAD41948.1 hypothetical protein LPB72_11745 [Hydrogenophaga crassostreae]
MLACLASGARAGNGGAPVPMLADLHRAANGLNTYRVSETCDGVRGYRDGERLVTGGGNPVQAPAWLTNRWPGITRSVSSGPDAGALSSRCPRFEQQLAMTAHGARCDTRCLICPHAKVTLANACQPFVKRLPA